MVSVTHSVAFHKDHEASLEMLTADLLPEAKERVMRAALFAKELYEDQTLQTGERVFEHGLGMSLILTSLKLDADCRIAALFFAIRHPKTLPTPLAKSFGNTVSRLVAGISRLLVLNPVLHAFYQDQEQNPTPVNLSLQAEAFRKMLLAMVEDVRVVLLRLASRIQTLRFFAKDQTPARLLFAKEAMDLYAPLANRLGLWELKWEMEDLSFRFLEPETYRTLAKSLEEKRTEREQFILAAVKTLKKSLQEAGILNAEIYGRPKHIFSIYNKMKSKNLDFSEVYDVRAVRIIVETIPECYTVLGLVHNLWTPILGTFDDYITSPKGNNYRSLHSALRCEDGRSLEVQIRTRQMHEHAELGVAAHWRYKEGLRSFDNYNDKIAILRQLLAWKDELGDTTDWISRYKEASFSEVLYVLTPQGRVIDLPKGATSLDFAYRLHTELGHRCRGARVNGILVPLSTPLKNMQKVEILTAKHGGPSRDWLNPASHYLTTTHAKRKVRQWFSDQEKGHAISEGRALLTRELQRLQATSTNIELLSEKLGFAKSDEMLLSLARTDISLSHIQEALFGKKDAPEDRLIPVHHSHRGGDATHQGVLIVGVDQLLTELAGCCKPAPPDAIIGFVTRGKGVSIHRTQCANFLHLKQKYAERVIESAWSSETSGVFPIDILLIAQDRQGLLRDLSDLISREKITIKGMHSHTKKGMAQMKITLEIAASSQLERLFTLLREMEGVTEVRRV